MLYNTPQLDRKERTPRWRVILTPPNKWQLFARLSVLSLSCFAELSHAQTTPEVPLNDGLCLVTPAPFDQGLLLTKKQIQVAADEAVIRENQYASFSGNVDIVTDSALIHASQAEITNNGKSVTASGDVRYQSPQLLVHSGALSVNSSEQTLNLQDTRYELTGFVGHGKAKEIDVGAESGISLKGVSLTTCPLGQEDWQLVASEISIQPGETNGEARHTRFYIGDIPVLYLPYFAFPVSNQPQSGLLFPLIGSSSSTGIDYEQPVYWNLAPNYDITLSPRMMTNRGLQLKSEFRYLTHAGKGQLNVEYLANDTKQSSDDARYFYRYQHDGEFSKNWFFNADVNGISDNNYIVDLGSDFYNRSDATINRIVGIDYYNSAMDFSLYLRDFDTIGSSDGIYRALPEAKLDWHQALSPYVNVLVNSELAYFDNSQQGNPSALRWHVAPTLSFPYRRSWGEISAETTLMNTYYHQRHLDDTELDEEVNRTLYQGRVYSALYFEKQDYLFNSNVTITLEPKVQYLYTSYEEQSNIGLYDTTALLIDVNGLFRGQEFTGLDRISDNDQITVGLTSRVIDDNNREQFVLSLGQIFYLSDTFVTASLDDTDRSALAAELDWRFDDNWFMHSALQIATDNDRVQRSGLALEYRHSAQNLIQLSHRYVRDLSGETIDQLGLSASWEVAENWQVVARSYRDLERERSIENYVGLEYESCCWAVRIVAERSLTNRYDTTGQQNTNEFDSSIGLEFIFKGIGSSSSRRAMLEDGMFGYRQPYVLN